MQKVRSRSLNGIYADIPLRRERLSNYNTTNRFHVDSKVNLACVSVTNYPAVLTRVDLTL